MFKINDNYLKLPGSYLFSTIAKKVNAYSEANPDKNIIRLGIGDVNEMPYGRVPQGHPVIVDYFYHEEIRGTENTGKRNR